VDEPRRKAHRWPSSFPLQPVSWSPDGQIIFAANSPATARTSMPLPLMGASL